MITPLETALRFYHQKIVSIPCRPMSKIPLIKWTKYRKYMPPLWRLVEWFSGDNNIALICGTGDLVVIDFDSHTAYNDWLGSHTRYTDTKMVRTKRGMHLYYLCDNLPDSKSEYTELEVKINSLIMSPPSLHPSGCKYEIVNNAEIMRIDDLSLVDSYKTPSKQKRVGVASGYQQTPPLFLLTRRYSRIHYIKANISITDLFQEYYPSGGNYAIAYCPCHNDKSPSLSLDLESNRANCFKSSCPLNGLHGHDVVDCWQIVNQVDIKTAIAQMMEII